MADAGDRGWRALAAAQAGLLNRAQIRASGVTAKAEAWRIAHERWQSVAPEVVATFTGELNVEQRLWLGQLHGGPRSLVGGVQAATLAGLRGWEREETPVFVPYQDDVPSPLRGFRYIRSRRDLVRLASHASGVPRLRLEPAVLLFASRERSIRSAEGLLAAVVQQRLCTPQSLSDELVRLAPLKRARHFRSLFLEIAGGAHSVAELDVRRMCRNFRLTPPARQVKRRDASGRLRFTDCEWTLPDGRILVLEVDGSFHFEVEHWEDDIARQRALSGEDRIIVRCSAREVRDVPGKVARDLVRLGVPGAA